VTGRGLLGTVLAGLCPDDAAQVRDACARWSRLRFAVDATAYPRPDAGCSPGREHVHHGACRCRGSSRTAPGWECRFTAATGHLGTAWAAPTDVPRTTPATRTSATITQVKRVLRRLRAAGHAMAAAPLFVSAAGSGAAALTDGLLGCPVHLLVRLAAGSVSHQDPLTWQGRHGRPARRGAAVHCLETGGLHGRRGYRAAGPEQTPAPEPGAGPGPRPARYPALRDRPGPSPARRASPHPRRPRLVRRPRPPAGAARHPRPRHRRTAAGRPGPAPGPVAVAPRPRPAGPRRAVARLPRQVRQRARLQAPQRRSRPQPPRKSAPRSRPTAGPGSSWPPAPSSCSPVPWPPTSAGPGKSTPIRPVRCHLAGSAGGFATSAATRDHPPVSRNPPAPGPAGPKAAAKAQHPATCSPAKPACRAPPTRH
jgi:hypothetical protein